REPWPRRPRASRGSAGVHWQAHYRSRARLRPRSGQRLGDHRPLPAMTTTRIVRNCGVWMGSASLAASLGGCVRHATATECGALLDRYVELLVREQDPKASEAEILHQKGITRENASHDVSFTSCPKEVSSRELGCAMGAPNVDEFEKCL